MLDPDANGVQGCTVFTYDDFRAGQASGPYVPPPNHITSIREKRYKPAKYYDANGAVAEQWEMCDPEKEPLATKNITARVTRRTRRAISYQL